MPDVDMVEEEKEKTQEEIDKVSFEDMKDQLKQIEKSVLTKEPRYLSRVLRSLLNTRKKLNEKILLKLLTSYAQSATKVSLLEFFDSAKAAPSTDDKPTTTTKKNICSTIS